MAPRLRIQPKRLLPKPTTRQTPYICQQCRRASLATATTPAPPIDIDPTITGAAPIARYPRNQPPSHKPPEFRKSQLHRQYQSLLRSSPLIIIFQHNNLKANEWMGIRRELVNALQKVDEELTKDGNTDNIGKATKIQVVQTGIFASALRVVEFWNPDFSSEKNATIQSTDPATATSTPIEDTKAEKTDPAFTHGLSTLAYRTAKRANQTHGLEPLLSGPLALLTFPSVSPQHLSAALSILSPSKAFPAPKRRANPGYHEPAVQNGVTKLMLLAARVEGKQVLDGEGVRWVGGIEGGLGGLRGQLVAMLQGFGAGVARTLESAGRSLYFTVEGRWGMLEEEGKEGRT